MRRLDLAIFTSLISLIIASPLLFSSCLDDDSGSYENDYVGNFEACWRVVDEHYCFFDEKNIDWNKVYKYYRPLAKDSVKGTLDEFNLLSGMLYNLRDGHVNLYAPFNTGRYWAWFEDYPQNFDENLLNKYYLGTKYWTASGMDYNVLDSVAYVRYSSFNVTPGKTNVDYVLSAMSYCKGLIIDIRNNGGGSLSNVPVIANRFATDKTIYGYICHKTGVGHNDFSDPEPMYLEPEPDRVTWDASVKPVVVLTNRSTFSAANNFIQAMRSLAGTPTMDKHGVSRPKMIVTMGDRSGGGGGMPFESVLPNGWIVRFSACPILDHKRQSTESGIEPDIKVDMDSLSMINDHKDDIIEAARTYILENYIKNKE